MEDFRQNIRAFLAFFGPSAGWLLVFFLAPLGIIWLYSFGETISLTEVKTTWTLAVLHQSPDKRGVPLPVKMVSQLTQTWHSQVRSFC